MGEGVVRGEDGRERESITRIILCNSVMPGGRGTNRLESGARRERSVLYIHLYIAHYLSSYSPNIQSLYQALFLHAMPLNNPLVIAIVFILFLWPGSMCVHDQCWKGQP